MRPWENPTNGELSLRRQCTQKVHKFSPSHRIEAVKRFVEEDKIGLMRSSPVCGPGSFQEQRRLEAAPRRRVLDRELDGGIGIAHPRCLRERLSLHVVEVVVAVAVDAELERAQRVPR